MVIAWRAVTVPRSPASTRAVMGPVPVAAPLGIVVLSVARPFPSVVPPETIVSRPGTDRVNVTSAPLTGRPSGSVTVSVSVIGSGRLLRENWYLLAFNAAASLPEPFLIVRVAAPSLPDGSVAAIVMGFEPAPRAIGNSNVPSAAAVELAVAPFRVLWARRVLRPWVFPF